MASLVDISPISDIRKFREAWDQVAAVPKDCQRFNPYSDEGGTVAGLTGDDYVIIGGDTRMSFNAFSILTRNAKKLHELTDNIYMASAGFKGDINQLLKVLKTKMRIYKFNFHKDMSVEAASEMLARTLYYKRFFPYYAANLLAGIDEQGKGALYTYDPVGTLERVPYSVQGAGTAMIEPLLDNQVGGKTQPSDIVTPLTKDRAEALFKDAFRAAAERDTTTGDSLYMVVLAKGAAPREEYVVLRSD